MTMEPHEYNLKIVQGATFYHPFAIDLPDGSTMDLLTEGGGYTIGRLTIRDKYPADGGEVILLLTNDNGGVVIGPFTDGNGVDWSGYWFASATQTAALIPFGEAVWDFEVSDGLRVERPFYGIARLLPEVTL